MSTISKNVTRKARIIFAARLLTDRRAAEIYLFALGWIILSYIVSLPHVFANMPALGNFVGDFQFFSYAIIHTNLFVQSTIAVIAIVFVFGIVDIFRSFKFNHLGQVRI
jgi:hypothetical protein